MSAQSRDIDQIRRDRRARYEEMERVAKNGLCAACGGRGYVAGRYTSQQVAHYASRNDNFASHVSSAPLVCPSCNGVGR